MAENSFPDATQFAQDFAQALKDIETQSKSASANIKQEWTDAATAFSGFTNATIDASTGLMTLVGVDADIVSSFDAIAKSTEGVITGAISLTGTLKAANTAAGASGTAAAGSIGGVTAFGAALNTALSVVSLVATAINLIITLFETFGKTSSVEGQKAAAATEALGAATDELISKAGESQAAHQQNMGAIEAEASQALNLAGALQTLKSSGDSSVGTQKHMQEITSQLVDLYPDLAGYVDEYSKTLNLSGEEIRKIIESEKELAETQELKKRGIELTEEAIQASANHTAVGLQLADVEAKIAEAEANGIKATSDLIESRDELIKKEEEARGIKDEAAAAEAAYAEQIKIQATDEIAVLQNKLAEKQNLTAAELENMAELLAMGGEFTTANAAQYEAMYNAQVDAMAAKALAAEEADRADKVREADKIQRIRDGLEYISAADAEALEQSRQKGEQLTAIEQAHLDAYNERQRAAVEEYQSILKSRTEVATNAFDTIQQNEAISLDQMIKNLTSNQKAMQSWTDNTAKLLEAGVDKGIIAQLEKMGPAGAAQAQKLVDELEAMNGGALGKFSSLNSATQGKINELEGLMGSGFEVATDSASASFARSEFVNAPGDAIGDMAGAISKSTEIQTAMEATMEGACEAVVKAMGDTTFVGAGAKAMNDMATEVRKNTSLKSAFEDAVNGINSSLPKLQFQVDRNVIIPTFSLSGTFNAQKGKVPSVNVGSRTAWYDKGGLFDSPQIIGIAERRAEFVGAAQDLRTFINGAIADAFTVRQNPELLRSVGGVSGNNALAGGDTNIYISNTFSPKEMTQSQMDYQAYKIRKELGRRVRI